MYGRSDSGPDLSLLTPKLQLLVDIRYFVSINRTKATLAWVANSG
jgi:hypothetical protein